MNKSFLSLIIFLNIIILLTSCMSSRLPDIKRVADQRNAKDGTGCFVEFNDGTLKQYTTLTLVTGLMKTPHLIANGKIKIEPKDIRLYQNSDHYAISQSLYNPKKPSYVAVETLPGFAIRIAKGSVNVYVRKFYNTQNAVDEFIIQEGTPGKMAKILSERDIKENEELMKFLSNKKYIELKDANHIEIVGSPKSISKIK